MKQQNRGEGIRIVFDVLIIIISYFVAYSLRFGALSNIWLFELDNNVEYYPLSEYAKYLLVVVPGYLYIFSKCDLYGARRRKRVVLWNLVKANVIGLVFIAFVLFFTKEMNISRWFLGIFFVVNTLLGFCMRHLVQSGFE